jgi:hypothetical protein
MKFIKTKIIFITLLFLTAQVQAFRFVVYSDCRAPKVDWTKPFPANLFNVPVLGYINSQVTQLNPRPDFVFFMGDMINRADPKAVPAPDPRSNLQYWKDFMTDGLDGIRLYVAVGNSDLYGTTWWTELPLQAAFAQTFNDMPNNGPTDPVDFTYLVYSFEFGQGDEKSLFVVLDAFGIYNGAPYYPTEVHCDNDFDPSPVVPTPAAPEQINWFNNVASNSTANHKFVFSHGPAFSVEGYPVARNVKKVVDVAMNYNFDNFFCAHEHLFNRWNIGIPAYQPAKSNIIQTLTGTSGALIDPSSNVNANREGRIHFDYTYVVVDVDGNNVIERTYTVSADRGNFTTHLIDTVLLVK